MRRVINNPHIIDGSSEVNPAPSGHAFLSGKTLPNNVTLSAAAAFFDVCFVEDTALVMSAASSECIAGEIIEIDSANMAHHIKGNIQLASTLPVGVQPYIAVENPGNPTDAYTFLNCKLDSIGDSTDEYVINASWDDVIIREKGGVFGDSNNLHVGIMFCDLLGGGLTVHNYYGHLSAHPYQYPIAIDQVGN